MKCRMLWAVAVWLASAALAADKPNFSGQWKLNVAKSDFGVLPPPASRTDTIQHTDQRFKLARVQTTGQGESKGEFDCAIGGPECPYQIQGAGLRFTMQVAWKENTLGVEGKGTVNDSQVKIVEQWTLSADGKAITIKRQLSSEQGSTEQSLLLEKQ